MPMEMRRFYSLGLGFRGHSLVMFWTKSERKIDQGREYYERTIDPNQYHIIGCDEDKTTQLLLYRSLFAGSTIRSYLSDTPEGVIERVFWTGSPEMSPNISFYSQGEYPHRDFALSCGICSSFFFPFHGFGKFGIMEIVSTCDQNVGALKKFCESFKGLCWSLRFQYINVQDYAIPEIHHLLEVVCQTFQLPLTQYWNTSHGLPYVVNQFSNRVFENLAPWCQFKNACFHNSLDVGQGPLGSSCEQPVAFYCRDLTALSITKYPFAHYARNCGSISCFAIYLRSIGQPDKKCALEFFLPAQEMDNHYPQTLFNPLWEKIKECLPNFKLASGEQLGQVLSVKIINSFANIEPESFKIGQHNSSLPHLEGSEYTRTLNLFQNNTSQRGNSYSYEEGATGKTSKGVPNEAFQPRTSEEHFEIRENTVAAERVDEPVEESTIEGTPCATSDVDVGCATSNIDTRNFMTTASQPFRFQTMKKPTQQEEETVILGNEGDPSQQLPRTSRALFECGIEPESLTSQPRRSEEIFRDEGYADASERVDNLVEVSLDDDIECEVPTASKRLKKSRIPFTVDNISKHFGRPLKDAAGSFGVSPSTFKRRCRSVGITWWQPRKRELIDTEKGKQNVSSSMRPLQDTPVASRRSQALEKMTVKATYNGVTVKFELTNFSGISELEDNVIKRLHLKTNSFSIKYQDNDNDMILIGCDEDVQECMNFSRTAEKATIKMLIHPPVNHYAP